MIILLVSILSFTSLASVSYSNSGSDWTGVCSTSTSQSPINLEVSSGTCDNSMVLDIQFSKTALSITMDRLQYTIQTNASISNLYATDIDGNLYGYTASYMNFHAPSEHTIEGSRYDLEMQIVHTLKDEFSSTITTAVVSLLFSVSSSDQPFFTTYDFSLVTNNTTTSNDSSIYASATISSINFNDLLGSQLDTNPAYYTYVGSLTIPDCTEGVNWYVVDTILPITQTQLDNFNTYFSGNSSFASGNGNNRELQSSNDRTIKKGGVACEEQFVYFFSFFILYIFINYFIFKLL